MSVQIHSDADMPECLSSWDKQAAHAARLAGIHCIGQPTLGACPPSPQGCFSRTAIVLLQNGQDVVVQFRLEPMDTTPFDLAHSILGDLVPAIREIQDTELNRDGVYVYLMSCIPGKTWEQAGLYRYIEIKAVVMQDLARVLSKCCISDGDTAQVIEDQVRPHLQRILKSEDPVILRFKGKAESLMYNLDSLKRLPLFLSHADLNYMNIMLDDDLQVSGLVDWEFSAALPFGMTFAHLSGLIGENIDGRFQITPDYDVVERAFWEEFLLHAPDTIRCLCENQPELVQTSVTLGILLNAFIIDGDKLVYNKVTPNALSIWLTYRIPMVRGANAPPFSVV
ncbi:hypothetical protein ANO11243_009680 [Dothideomycetidae sp. 11243]|nr:hypothetical protein ANO11243_009680 [fungal sp. No.11243]